MQDIEKYIYFMRKQRHDFMNYFQIIYGYLQTDNISKALGYLEKLSEENRIISAIYGLGDNYFGFCLENNIREVIKREYSVKANVEIEKLYKEFFKENYARKKELVKNVFDEIKKKNVKHVFIYIFEDKLGQSALICNNEDLVDELNWMENWELIDNKNIQGLKLHKCEYGRNLGYRVTFLL